MRKSYKSLRKDWKAKVQGVMQMETGSRPAVLERAFISVERYSSGGGLDWDNAFGGLKPLLDCLVSPTLRNPDGLGLITDDGPKHVPLPFAFKQLPAKPGHDRTIVRIYDASALPN